MTNRNRTCSWGPNVVGNSHARQLTAMPCWRHTRARLVVCACFLLLTAAVIYPRSASAATTSARRHPAHAAVQHNPKGSATPTIKLKLLGTAVNPQGILTDDERWAIYEPRAGITRIMNTLTGKIFARADPEGCSEGLRTIGGGGVLYECDDPECPERTRWCYPVQGEESRRYEIVNLETGAAEVVPDTNDVPIQLPTLGGEFRLDAIGSQWVAGAGWEAFFINLHTAKIIKQSEREQTDKEVYDLNEPGLAKSLCAPLTLEASELNEKGEPAYGDKYLPAEYDPPFAHISAYKVGSYGYLERCGSSKRLPLSRCGEGGAEIGGGVLSCGEDFITRLLSLRRYPWHGVVYRLRRLSPEGEFETIRHTATMIFARVSHEPGRIYFANLPWAKIRAKS